MMLFAVAAIKSLQPCLTLCDPIDGSPPGSPITGILQARILEWVAISFSKDESEKWKQSRSVVSDLQWPQGLKHQAPLSMGFSRQEYWSGAALPSPWCSLVIVFWIWYIIKFCYKILRFFLKNYLFLIER